jgi:hypothetical protein
MAEEDADDGALYDVWSRLTAEEVDSIEQLLDDLAERVRVRRDKRPTRDMIDDARELRDGPLGLGFLPIVSDLLANSLAP